MGSIVYVTNAFSFFYIYTKYDVNFLLCGSRIKDSKQQGLLHTFHTYSLCGAANCGASVLGRPDASSITAKLSGVQRYK